MPRVVAVWGRPGILTATTVRSTTVRSSAVWSAPSGPPPSSPPPSSPPPSSQHRPAADWSGNGTSLDVLFLVDHFCLLRRLGCGAGAALPSRLSPSRLSPSRLSPSRLSPSRLSPSRLSPSRPGRASAGLFRRGVGKMSPGWGPGPGGLGEAGPDGLVVGGPAGRVSECRRQISKCGNSTALAGRPGDDHGLDSDKLRHSMPPI